jgi:hypothetical protein
MNGFTNDYQNEYEKGTKPLILLGMGTLGNPGRAIHERPEQWNRQHKRIPSPAAKLLHWHELAALACLAT